jgi:hypothetical protein
VAGRIDLYCKSPECGSPVLLVLHTKKMPVGTSRIIAVHGNSMLVECGECLAVSSWWIKKPKPDRAAWARSGKLSILPGTTYQLERDIVPLMQERWSTFSKAKLRERGRVASGLRFDVFARDDFRCRYCGRSADDGAILHADHVVPESKGGPTTLENLVTACIDCNLGKSAKDLPETASVLR